MKEVNVRTCWISIPKSALDLHKAIDQILREENVKYVAFKGSWTARHTYLQTLEVICTKLRNKNCRRIRLYLFDDLEEFLNPELFASFRFYLYVFSREKLDVYYKPSPENNPYVLIASFPRILAKSDKAEIASSARQSRYSTGDSTGDFINIVVDGGKIVKVLNSDEAEKLRRNLEYIRKVLGIDLNVRIEKIDKNTLINLLLDALQRGDEVSRKILEILNMLLLSSR